MVTFLWLRNRTWRHSYDRLVDLPQTACDASEQSNDRYFEDQTDDAAFARIARTLAC